MTKLITNIALISIPVIMIIISPGQASAWELVDYFYQDITLEEFERRNPFDPDKDILYLPERTGKDLFKSVEDLSAMRDPAVRKYIYLYLTRARPFLCRAIDRSKTYGSIVKESFSNENIPQDLALLPLLESGFNPHAVSKSKATGLWQFLLNTSKQLGLKTDRWTDERRHIDKSTQAAIRHLKNLHLTFNNWELALAAYNGGAGHVGRAMKKTGATNLKDLRASGELSEESSEFVAKYTALMLLYKNQKLFGIEDEIPKSDDIPTEKYMFKKPVDIRDISRLANIPVDLIKKYNPELNANITPPYYAEYPLRLPAGSLEKISAIEKELYKKNLARIKPHTVQKGETLSLVAVRYKRSLKELIEFNKIQNPAYLKIGQVIYIP